jgi:hypothetical protein
MRGGMEKTPPIFKRPVLRDPFFWLLTVTLALWAAFFWLVFG